jgi:hypothetical protein
VNALKDELQRADLSSERRRQLTHALHHETEALIRRNAAKDARDTEKTAKFAARRHRRRRCDRVRGRYQIGCQRS